MIAAPRRLAVAAIGAASLALVPFAAAGVAAPLHGGCSPSGELVTRQAESKSYTYTLTVGMPETMVMSAADARKQKLADAEVMVGGSMDTPKGATNHLEVHVCGSASRKVISSPVTGISLADLTSGRTLAVPVMVMLGLDAPSTDRHFGNNIPLIAGHRYRVTVTMGGETATFAFVGPKGAKPGSADGMAMGE